MLFEQMIKDVEHFIYDERLIPSILKERTMERALRRFGRNNIKESSGGQRDLLSIGLILRIKNRVKIKNMFNALEEMVERGYIGEDQAKEISDLREYILRVRNDLYILHKKYPDEVENDVHLTKKSIRRLAEFRGIPKDELAKEIEKKRNLIKSILFKFKSKKDIREIIKKPFQARKTEKEGRIRNTESRSEPFESKDFIENALLSYVSLWRKSGEKVTKEFIEKRNPKLYELCNRFGINIDEILEKSSEELDREIKRRKEFYEESARYVSKYTFRVIEESYPAIEQRMKVMRLEKERRVNADELWSKLHEEEKEDLRKIARTALRREYKKSLYYNSNGAIEEKAKLLLLKTRERPGWSECPIPFCVGGEILSALSFCCDPHMKCCKYRTGVLDEIGLSEARFKEIKDEFARENNWFSNEVCFGSLSYCCMTGHCPDRDHVLIRLYGRYLFSIDPVGLKAKQGETSLSEILKELKENFRSHGITLSENAMIEETEGGELEITDRGEVYIIKRDKGELKVYGGDLEKVKRKYFELKRLLAIRLLEAAENKELVKPYLEELRRSVEREKESSPVMRETKTSSEAGYFMSSPISGRLLDEFDWMIERAGEKIKEVGGREKPVPNKTTKNPKDIELMILESKLREKCEIKHTEWDELEIPYKEKPHRGVVHTIYRKGLMELRRIGRIMTSYDHDKKTGYIGHTELSKGYRGKGLSYNILNIAFNDLISRGATKFVVSRVMPYGQIIYRRLSVGIIKSLMNYGFAPEFDPNSLKEENLQKISISHRRGSPIAYKVKLKGKTIWAILTDENGDPITNKDYYKAHRDIDFIRKEYEEGRVLLGNVRYEVKDYDKFWSQMSVVKPPEILDITDSLENYVKLNSKDIDGIRGNVYGWVVRNKKKIYWKDGIYYLTKEDYADCCKYLKTDDLGVSLSEILTKDIGKSLQRAIKLRGREREKRLNEIWMEFKRILKSCNPIERHSKIHDLWNNGILKIGDEGIRREVKKSLKLYVYASDLDTDTRNEILLLMKKDHDYSVEEISVDETGIDVRKLKETFFTFREYMNTVLFNPKWGYYGSGKAKIGGRAIEKRDFDTFPEILSPLFGEMIAKQIFAMWWSMKEAGLIKKGEIFEVLELGAGSGVLAHDILSYLSRKSKEGGHWGMLWENLVYTTGEISSTLRERQKQLNAKFGRHIRIKYADAKDLLEFTRKPFKGVILSNELIDTFGFERIRLGKAFIEKGTFEVCLPLPTLEKDALHRLKLSTRKVNKLMASSQRYIEMFDLPELKESIYLSKKDFIDLENHLAGLKDKGIKDIFDLGLYFKEIFINGELFPGLFEYIEMMRPFIVEKIVSNKGRSIVMPVNTDSGNYIRSVAEILNRRGSAGYVITIDYGGNAQSVILGGGIEEREAIRSGNYRYKIPTRFNPYLKPGDVDITSNLNFSYLHLTGKRSGLETVFFGPQNCLAVPEQRIGNIDLSTSEGYAREKVNNYEIFIKEKEGSPVDFDMLIQSSINIPEDMRYRNPFSEIWGIERLALEPQEMLQVSPDEKILGSDNLKRDLKKVGVGNVEEFCSELKEWGKGRDELTSRLFSKFRRDSRGKKVLEVLEKWGLLKKGVSIEEGNANPPKRELDSTEIPESFELDIEDEDYKDIAERILKKLPKHALEILEENMRGVRYPYLGYGGGLPAFISNDRVNMELCYSPRYFADLLTHEISHFFDGYIRENPPIDRPELMEILKDPLTYARQWIIDGLALFLLYPEEFR
ncbi:MAG: hypothetical protein DRO76_04820, partial [Candidatus Altiarchaeales archaeon]